MSLIPSIFIALILGVFNALTGLFIVGSFYNIPCSICLGIVLFITLAVGIILFPVTILCLPEFVGCVSCEVGLFLSFFAGTGPLTFVLISGVLAIIIGVIFYIVVILFCFVGGPIDLVCSPSFLPYYAVLCVPTLAIVSPIIIVVSLVCFVLTVFVGSQLVCLGFLCFDVLFFLYEIVASFLMIIPFVTGIGITICSSYMITLFPLTIALFTLIPTIACLYLLFWFTFICTYPFALVLVVPAFFIVSPFVGIFSAVGTICGAGTVCMMLPAGCSIMSMSFPLILIFTLCAGVSLMSGGTFTGILFGISVPILFICLTFSIFPLCITMSPVLACVLFCTLVSFGCSSSISFILSPCAILTSILGGSSSSGGSVNVGGLSSVVGSLLGSSSGGLGVSYPASNGILPTITSSIFGKDGCIPTCQTSIFGTGAGNTFGALSYVSEFVDICGNFARAVGTVTKDSIDVFARHWCSFSAITSFARDVLSITNDVSAITSR